MQSGCAGRPAVHTAKQLFQGLAFCKELKFQKGGKTAGVQTGHWGQSKGAERKREFWRYSHSRQQSEESSRQNTPLLVSKPASSPSLLWRLEPSSCAAEFHPLALKHKFSEKEPHANSAGQQGKLWFWTDFSICKDNIAGKQCTQSNFKTKHNTPLGVKQIASGKLLYSTGSSAWSSVMAWEGRWVMGREGVQRVCVCVIHFIMCVCVCVCVCVWFTLLYSRN